MKLSIADLVDNCSAEELMIEKEERELTARVKARQQELRAERNLNEHQTESNVEYETPDESTPGVVLLSTINDGEFQEVYVNVSPVTEEEIAGYPEQPISFRWQIVGSDLKGFADPWITPVSSVWHLRYPAAEAVYTGSDLELQKAWLRVEDSICMNARIIFSDGSSWENK